ncbi:MAG: PLP-dependent aminotransferase family protein, partial [Candidatus Eisenbacteria bacterium]|nr:PLP-dependent aminotransferase family protein [Candidatus Eisenbacteria bacterium]
MGAKRRPTNAGDHLVDSIQLDRSGDKPLYLQLGEILRQQMASGRLPVGAKLPATRELSDALSVNRATVVEAYRWLRLQGWVRSGVGSGTYVTGRALGFGGDANLVQSRPGTGAGVLADAEGDGFWSSRIEELPRPEAKSETQAPAWTIRFTSPTADPDGFPIDEFRSVLEEVLDREGARSLDYGPPDGYGPLRELIAERLARQSVRVDPSQVLLVNGSQQGLDLVFRMLVPKGRTLILEEPTYHLALRTARALRLPVAAVPLDAEGLRIDRLERVLDETDAGMLYTMPVFQNPTGLNLSAERRERLLSLSAERKLPVVEDHFDAELDYRGDAPPPLLSHGSPQNVVLLGTFSKILFPGLRVGWMVVPEAVSYTHLRAHETALCI